MASSLLYICKLTLEFKLKSYSLCLIYNAPNREGLLWQHILLLVMPATQLQITDLLPLILADNEKPFFLYVTNVITKRRDSLKENIKA